jgi:type III pantothenate kinase
MNLLLDIGNTRIKWAQLDGGALGTQHALPYAGWTSDNIVMSLLSAVPRPERVLIANVGGAAIGTAVREAVARHWTLEPEVIVSTAAAAGVRNAYAKPANLGVDRWLGIIAAHALTSRAACVVSVGTAMTIDGVAPDGRHLGGSVVPGPDLMVSAVLRNTSDVAARAEGGAARPGIFADNTLGAVHQGATHALAALIERAVDTIAHELGESPELMIAGGASASLVPLIRRPVTLVPDLVLRGLAVLAKSPPSHHAAND